MKLVIAIVQDEDTSALTEALIAAGHRFTKVSTTGSFLRTGNTSLLIGVPDDQVGEHLFDLHGHSLLRSWAIVGCLRSAVL